jgi:hypothetical protein
MPVFLSLGSVLYPPPIPAPSCSSRSWIHVVRLPCWGQQDQLLHLQIYNEVDGDTSKHHLSASNYGPESEWVLLTHAQ